MPDLSHRSIAVLATDGVEQVELTAPVHALREAGARVLIVSPQPAHLRGWNHQEMADSIPVDLPLAEADPASFDALLLPGGVINPDSLRIEPKAIAFIRHFVEAGKPIAAICHGPWTLIDAGGVAGRRMTSWPSLRADLTNAGADWEDSPVVADRGLVTARRPDDIPAFVAAMLEAFAAGRPAGR
jgi:protease I